MPILKMCPKEDDELFEGFEVSDYLIKPWQAKFSDDPCGCHFLFTSSANLPSDL